MKKLFFLAALAIALVTTGCSKSDDNDTPATGRDSYIGKYLPTIKIHCEYQDDLGETKTNDFTFPDLIDALEITADPDNENAIIFNHNIIKGNAIVDGNTFKLSDFNYEKSWDGILTGYGCNLNIVNNPGVFEIDLLGFKKLSWTATFTGSASGALIGIEAEKNVTGTIEFNCLENKF